MSPGDPHACIFYEDSPALWDLCIPLIQDSQRDGLKWLYVADERGADAVKVAFEERLGAPLTSGQVIDAATLNLVEPLLSADTIIAQFRAQADAAFEQGYSGLFLLVEMTWALRAWPSVAFLGEYEAALHELLASANLRGACLYNWRVFPAPMMLDVLRTHPRLHAGERFYANPHYLPPQVYLSGDAHAQLQCWLNAISQELAQAYRISAPSEDAHPADSPDPVHPRFPTTSKTPIYSLESPTPLIAHNPDQERWKIHALGRLRIYDQEGTALQWNTAGGATNKVKTLFAYLLQRGQQGATAEEMADLLWPDASSTEQSLNRLYHAIHCLRMVLGARDSNGRNSPYVLNHDKCYFLALPEGTWIDIPVFEQLCYRGETLVREKKDREALICHKAAEKLYSGDLLADLPIVYTDNIDLDWCWSRRYWLREMYLKMLSDMAGIYRRASDAPRALAYCEKVLQMDPCAEKAHREMMRVFHLTGRPDALERQYRLCRQALKRFDGRGPSRITRELYQSLTATA